MSRFIPIGPWTVAVGWLYIGFVGPGEALVACDRGAREEGMGNLEGREVEGAVSGCSGVSPED